MDFDLCKGLCGTEDPRRASKRSRLKFTMLPGFLSDDDGKKVVFLDKALADMAAPTSATTRPQHRRRSVLVERGRMLAEIRVHVDVLSDNSDEAA